VIAEDGSSAQQITRVKILRYLDLQLSRALRWIDNEADLLAVVVRSQIELRFWAEHVSKGSNEAEAFLNEVEIDAKELHEKMVKAFPAAPFQPLPVVFGRRIKTERSNDEEEYAFKLCSKLIHPSALMLNHPELTITNEANKEYLAVQVLFYGWWLVSRFHDLNWNE
jgi:hypothetical protein